MLLHTLNFSTIACTPSINQHCLGGGGGERSVQGKELQSVPGILATIVALGCR